jgi:phage repressor protein C with HTH and peptisase S24 domain
MEIVQRIKELIEEKYGARGSSSFAKAIGVEQVTLSRHLNGSRNLSLDVIDAILRTFPDVSAEWLLRGIESDGEIVSSSESKPRIPYDAAAGCLTDAVDGVTAYQCEQLPVVQAFPKYDFTIRITGDSMMPNFHPGDEVACLRVNEARFLQWGRVYVLDTEQGIVIKRIYDNGDSIRCASYNPEYPDFNIPKEDIRSYNLVVGALRL